MNKIAKVTSKGQITIPREVRRFLGIESGEYLEFTKKENSITINKVETHEMPKLVDIQYSTKTLSFTREEANER